MNFKQLFFFLFLMITFFSSCGVKGPPKAPPGTQLPSLKTYYSQKPPFVEQKQQVDELLKLAIKTRKESLNELSKLYVQRAPQKNRDQDQILQQCQKALHEHHTALNTKQMLIKQYERYMLTKNKIIKNYPNLLIQEGRPIWEYSPESLYLFNLDSFYYKNLLLLKSCPKELNLDHSEIFRDYTIHSNKRHLADKYIKTLSRKQSWR